MTRNARDYPKLVDRCEVGDISVIELEYISFIRADSVSAEHVSASVAAPVSSERVGFGSW